MLSNNVPYLADNSAHDRTHEVALDSIQLADKTLN